ncbi:MAG: radical SAM protein [Candidatus Hydrogenedentes bacterium]|nr:radical SAM protein [Candidatus Hydrogenedentota bacterium]
MQSNFYNWEQLTICITSCCNLNCRMCPVVSRKKKSIPREIAFQIVKFAIEKGFKRVVLGGGEPTLMSYFNDIIEELTRNNIEIWILTNAVDLSPFQIKYFSEHKNIVVNISIDGVGEVHDFIRGEGTFESTLANLDRLTSEGANVAINTVIQRSNYDKSIETYEYFKNYPLLWHGFSFAEPWHQKELVPPELIPTAINQLYEIHRRDQRYKNNVSLTSQLIKDFDLSSRYPEFIMHPGENCPIPTSHLGVDEEGWVVPCWHYPFWRKNESRNIYNRSLWEITEETEIRNEINKAISKEGCKGCSTVCYFWNEKFRTRVIAPSGKWYWNKKFMIWKLGLKNKMPKVHRIAGNIKDFFIGNC